LPLTTKIDFGKLIAKNVEREDFLTQIRRFHHGAGLKHIWSYLYTALTHDSDTFTGISSAVGKRVPLYAAPPKSSKIERTFIGIILSHLPPKTQQEQGKAIGIYIVDLFLPPKDIIEVNGEHHYYLDTPRRTGEYQVKYSNLTKRGYKVHEFDLREYGNLQVIERGARLEAFAKKLQSNRAT
jgi:very-short-patch-repair endonuclease